MRSRAPWMALASVVYVEFTALPRISNCLIMSLLASADEFAAPHRASAIENFSSTCAQRSQPTDTYKQPVAHTSAADESTTRRMSMNSRAAVSALSRPSS